MRLINRTAAAFLGAALAIFPGGASADGQGRKGWGAVSTDDPLNRRVGYFYYVPERRADEILDVLIGLPGLNTGGESFDTPDWIEFADRGRFVLVAPSFAADEKGFAAERSFQFPAAWSGQALLDILREVGTRAPIRSFGLSLFGFSAGAQTAHRFALWRPEICRAAAFFAPGRTALPERSVSCAFLTGCGEHDERRPQIKAFTDRARSLGISAQLKIYPDWWHALSPQMEKDARRFFLEVRDGSGAAAPAAVTVPSLLQEMADFEALARRPRPFFKEETASSYSRESHKGGEAWFDNKDVGQYVRTEMIAGRKEHVLADLHGPGTVTRFWSANPDLAAVVRFYFDGEAQPRLEMPLSALFTGHTVPWGPEFSYISGTGGNLYYPIPFGRSLKISIEEKDKPVRLYYEIGQRIYPEGTAVETYDPSGAAAWAGIQAETAKALSRPRSAASSGARPLTARLTVEPGQTAEIPALKGEQAVFEWSARIPDTRESRDWGDPLRPHNAWRQMILDIDFDGEHSIGVPLGDFFGSAPGVNPCENLFFTVAAEGTMTSRLLMPFKSEMRLRLTNTGPIARTVELRILAGPHPFDEGTYHLRAQWGTVTRDSWPFFDQNFLKTTGEGKVVGTVYQIANPALIWWGEGDQKVFVDGEEFPSTFGTGTEDDYGFAYGDNRPFTRPYHAQTRVDGPWSGGHISLNRWYVLDALPYRAGMRFDQEMWHWMPCRPTWTHVIYWYAAPGTPGPRDVERAGLAPRDLGVREDMLDPLEAEGLRHEETGGAAKKERLANCSGAEHLVWRGGEPGSRQTVHFPVAAAGRYAVEINLCMSPDYGRFRFFVDGRAAAETFDGYSPALFWRQVDLGVFDLRAGDNELSIEALGPNAAARPGSLFGLDYIFLRKK